MRPVRFSLALFFVSLLPAQVFEPLDGAPTGVAAFDVARDRLVRLDADGSTWEWDRTRWFQRVARGPAPAALFQMVYDASHRRTIALVNHNVGPDTLHAYDGSAWTQIPVPVGLDLRDMVCDPVRNRLVLLNMGSSANYDTWPELSS